jgi:hypothetical protein
VFFIFFPPPLLTYGYHLLSSFLTLASLRFGERGVSANAKGGGGGKYEKVGIKEKKSKSKRYKNKGKWK